MAPTWWRLVRWTQTTEEEEGMALCSICEHLNQAAIDDLVTRSASMRDMADSMGFRSALSRPKRIICRLCRPLKQLRRPGCDFRRP